MIKSSGTRMPVKMEFQIKYNW